MLRIFRPEAGDLAGAREVPLESTPSATGKGAQLGIACGKALKQLVIACPKELAEPWSLARVFNLGLPGSGDRVVRI
jgi:hypothetical protein